MLQLATVTMRTDAQIIPYHPNHYYSIELKGYELDYIRTIPNYDQYINENATPGLTWTVIIRGKVVAIFGLRFQWDRVAELWMLPGVGIENDPISVTRGARKILDNVIQEYDIMRLQIAVRVQNVTAYKFAKALYFEQEALMRCYGPELADYYLMSRLQYVRDIQST